MTYRITEAAAKNVINAMGIHGVSETVLMMLIFSKESALKGEITSIPKRNISSMLPSDHIGVVKVFSDLYMIKFFTLGDRDFRFSPLETLKVSSPRFCIGYKLTQGFIDLIQDMQKEMLLMDSPRNGEIMDAVTAVT